MFDAKRLLGQFVAKQIGGAGHGRVHSASGGIGGGGFGSSPLEGLARSIGANPALAGGLASLVFGSKAGRKFGGSATKFSGMALVGSLAFQAYQRWQKGQSDPGRPEASGRGVFVQGGAGEHAPARPGSAARPASFIPPVGSGALSKTATSPWAGQEAPAGSAFSPSTEADQQRLSRMLLRAMIAAAKADGHVDAAEQAAIFRRIDELDLDPNAKAFVLDELRAPVDVDALARSARNGEEAAELYAASLLAIDVDNAAERGYLAMLAARLNLPEDLVAHLHATIEEAATAT